RDRNVTGVQTCALPIFRIEFNEMLHSRVVAKFEGREIAIGDFAPSESLTVAGKEIRDFTLHEVKRETVRDAMCAGQRVTLTGARSEERRVGKEWRSRVW